MPAIIILGGHRCGTSVTARLIHELGFPASPSADRLLRPQPGHESDNPHGYFEDAAFVKLHRRMLGEHQLSLGGWKNPRRNDAEIERLRANYRQRILERNEASRDWSLKDPRLCLVGDVLLETMDALSIDYQIVTTPRAIDEVVSSLGRRGLAEDDATRIAEMYEAGRRAVVQAAVECGVRCLEVSLASGRTPEEVEVAVRELVKFLGRDKAAVGELARMVRWDRGQ